MTYEELKKAYEETSEKCFELGNRQTLPRP